MYSLIPDMFAEDKSSGTSLGYTKRDQWKPRLVNSFRYPTIAGTFQYDPKEALETSSIEWIKKSAGTCLPFHTYLSDNYQCATTGDYACLGESGCVTLIGDPRFEDERLDSLAKLEGPANALAEAYTQSRTTFMSRVWGAFSFCIIDPENDCLIAGVDRFGRFPLYYETTPGRVTWSTSAKALCSTEDSGQKLTRQGLYNYCYFHMVPSPLSIFDGIKKLPAAHILEYKKGTLLQSRYWQPDFRHENKQSFQESCTNLIPVLRRSVERAMGNGQKVGAFLSGGLDSSSVTGMLAELSDTQAEAFCIGFDEKGYDETEYARITAKHFGVRLHEYYVTPEDIVEALPKVARSYDEPFGNSSALPAYFCAKFAVENGIERLLAGDGGDEIFAGNERYGRQRIFEAYSRIPLPIRKNLIEKIAPHLPKGLPLASKVNSYITQANTPLPGRLQAYNFLHRHLPEEIFLPEFLDDVRQDYPGKLEHEFFHVPQETSALNRMLYLDWQFTLADNDLRKVSQMCALAGAEVTYPMLDDELVAFSCEIPDEWKLKGNDLRHFYRQALKDWLPRETISKSKQGFGLPFGMWMETHDPLRELAYASIDKLKIHHIFKPSFLDKTIELHRSEHAAYYGELVWILTVLSLWLDARDDGVKLCA